MLFIGKRIFCVPCFIWFLLPFKMWELFLLFTVYIYIYIHTHTHTHTYTNNKFRPNAHQNQFFSMLMTFYWTLSCKSIVSTCIQLNTYLHIQHVDISTLNCSKLLQNYLQSITCKVVEGKLYVYWHSKSVGINSSY